MVPILSWFPAVHALEPRASKLYQDPIVVFSNMGLECRDSSLVGHLSSLYQSGSHDAGARWFRTTTEHRPARRVQHKLELDKWGQRWLENLFEKRFWTVIPTVGSPMSAIIKKNLIIFKNANEWAPIWQKIIAEHGPSIAISFKLRRELGFSIRHHQEWIVSENRKGFPVTYCQNQIHLDFYNPSALSWFQLRYL